MNAVDITLSIVNWNGGEEILAFLRSIFLYTKHISFEVIVVDNDSTDDSLREIKNLFPQVKILKQTYNSGYARAHNRGWKEGHGRYFAFLNLDMALCENSFEKIVHYMDNHPQVQVCTPTLVYDDFSLQPNVKRNPTLFAQIIILLKLHFWIRKPVQKYLARDFDYQKESEVEQIMGACVIARREILEKIKGWGEEYFPILWEDVDFCKKVQLHQGKIVYTPITKIIHYESTSFLRFQSVSRQKRFNKGLLIYFKKYHKLYEYWILKFLNPLSLFLAWGVQIANLKPRSQARASKAEDV